MPGKVNPATAEMMCAEAGQLEVNVMMPYVAYALLEMLAVMTQAVRTFDEKGVLLIQTHPDRCRRYAERSVGNAAKLNEEVGFMGAAEVAMQAIETGKTIQQMMKERESSPVH
jgi:aspartate ammonia-lyase